MALVPRCRTRRLFDRRWLLTVSYRSPDPGVPLRRTYGAESIRVFILTCRVTFPYRTERQDGDGRAVSSDSGLGSMAYNLVATPPPHGLTTPPCGRGFITTS